MEWKIVPAVVEVRAWQATSFADLALESGGSREARQGFAMTLALFLRCPAHPAGDQLP